MEVVGNGSTKKSDKDRNEYRVVDDDMAKFFNKKPMFLASLDDLIAKNVRTVTMEKKHEEKDRKMNKSV